MKWYSYQGALLPRVAPHYEVNLTKEEQKELLKISKALFLRYTNEWDRDDGEFWYVIKDKEESLNSYKSRERNQIKKGLKNCIVKRVDKSLIATKEGYEVYFNAFNNYDTFHQATTIEEFKQDILTSIDEFWAVYNHENRLIAYANNFIEEGMCHYNSMKFYPKFLNLYPSYALIYTMDEYYLNQKKYLYVNDGARSIAHGTNIQEFLIKKFHFKRQHCKLNIAYRWEIKILVSLLYPFRDIIKYFKFTLFDKIVIVLKQEEIRRSFESK